MKEDPFKVKPFFKDQSGRNIDSLKRIIREAGKEHKEQINKNPDYVESTEDQMLNITAQEIYDSGNINKEVLNEKEGEQIELSMSKTYGYLSDYIDAIDQYINENLNSGGLVDHYKTNLNNLKIIKDKREKLKARFLGYLRKSKDLTKEEAFSLNEEKNKIIMELSTLRTEAEIVQYEINLLNSTLTIEEATELEKEKDVLEEKVKKYLIFMGANYERN